MWVLTRNIKWLLERAKKINSRLILALDLYAEPRTLRRNDVKDQADSLLSRLCSYVVAVKIGWPTILTLGVDEIKDLIDKHREFYYIADMKIADVGHVNRVLCKYADYMGFDAVIVHAIIGRVGGLDDVVSEVHEKGGAVFALCAMSHRGAEDALNRNFRDLLKLSINANVDGFVLPATQPYYIAEARKIIGYDKVIISPGVIAQGACIGDAIKHGSDFEIIGRGIYASKDPIKSAKEFASKLKWSSGDNYEP